MKITHKKIWVFGILIIFSIWFSPDKESYQIYREAKAQSIITIAVSTTTLSNEINTDIKKYANKWGVNPAIMGATVWCEINGTPSTTLQSYVIDKNGDREESYGVAQWNLPSKNTKLDGSVITYKDAINLDVALDNMAWYFSTGRAHDWSCWRELKGIE